MYHLVSFLFLLCTFLFIFSLINCVAFFLLVSIIIRFHIIFCIRSTIRPEKLQFYTANIYFLIQIRRFFCMFLWIRCFISSWIFAILLVIWFNVCWLAWHGMALWNDKKNDKRNLFKSIIVGNCIFMPNTIAILNSQYEATAPCPHIWATMCEKNFIGRVLLWQKYRKKEQKHTWYTEWSEKEWKQQPSTAKYIYICGKVERLIHNK